MYNRYISDVSHLRSHHWKYWLDVYENCGFDCSYCVYRIGDKMGRIKPAISSVVDLRSALRTIDPGILYLGPKADIYQPRDANLQLTRPILSALCDQGVPVFTVTRSPLALRDLDIFQQMAAAGNIEISVTIASTKEIDSIEPNTPSVEDRLELIAKLKRSGVTVSVHMSPIIPHLDTTAEICELMRRCRDAGADCIYACVLGMSDAYADHVEQAVKAHDPGFDMRTVYPHPKGGGAVYSADSSYLCALMNDLAHYAETHAIPFASVHLPELDTAERNGGIFREKVPTVGDMCRHLNRWGRATVSWSELRDYVTRFPAVDALILDTIARFWDERLLFQNTHFHPMSGTGGEIIYKRMDTVDLKISNMRVEAA